MSQEVVDRLFTVALIQRLKKYKWNYSAARWSRFVLGGTLTAEFGRQMSLLSSPLAVPLEVPLIVPLPSADHLFHTILTLLQLLLMSVNYSWGTHTRSTM